MVKDFKQNFPYSYAIHKLLITIILIVSTTVAFAQSRNITIQGTKTVADALKSIEKQSTVRFVYNNTVINAGKNVNLNLIDVTVEQALKQILEGQRLTYTKQENGVIIIKDNNEPAVAQPIQNNPTQAAAGLVTGIVKDKAGAFLSNVSVMVQGTSYGTVTNNNGQFSIQAERYDSLSFSSVGYEPQTLYVGNNKILNATLEAIPGTLNDVVVVGYGRQRKISTVGAQSSVKAEDLKIPARDLTNAIAGRLAGVTVVQRSGEPGYDGADLYIRGVATFASSPRSPLLVVDGVPDRSINNIDPEDIESFTVLKDATATAVYGTRGANGIILITTKKGRERTKPEVSVEIDKGISKFTQLPQFVDGPTFMKLYNEARTMRGLSKVYTAGRIDTTSKGIDPELYPNVNWYDVLFKKIAGNQRANLNVRGGSNVMNYYIAVGYYGETGMFKKGEATTYNSNLKFDRYNFLTNITSNITKSTKVELGVNGYITNGNLPGGYRAQDIFHYATMTPPHVIPQGPYSTGEWPEYPGTKNPSPYMFLTQSGYTTQTNTVVRSNIRLTQNLDFITKGLSLYSMFAFDNNSYGSSGRTRTLPTYWAIGRDTSTHKLITQLANNEGRSLTLNFVEDRSVSRRLYSESGINYNNNFGEHNVSALFLFNQSDYINFNAPDYFYSIPYRSRGLVGRATYGYSNRYFLEGNFGYTGSENFSPNHRYGFFPSGGVGWVVSNEKFFDGIKDFINYFKLRYSYGLSGNSNTGSRFLYLSTIDANTSGYKFGIPGNYQSFGGVQEGQIGIDASWETSYRHNIGIELNTWHNALQFVVELFKEKRSGILMRNLTIPYASGFRPDNVPYGNIGKTENKGIDVTVNLNKNLSKDFNIGFNGTFTYNINKVINDELPAWQYPWLNRDGHAIDQRFGYVALGLFKDSTEILASPVQPGDVRPGDIKYKDLNNDGKITSSDITAIGYGSVPKILYGLNFIITYRKFDMAIFFQGAGLMDFSYNTRLYNSNNNSYGDFATMPFSQGPTLGNMYNMVMDRWTPEQAAANPNFRPFYPRLSTNDVTTTNYMTDNMSNYTSTWWLYRADYLRLKNAEIGYNFGSSALAKLAVSKARIFISGTNLFTWSKWKLWDPEMGDGSGIRYPNVSVYNIGFRLNFN